MQFDPPDDPREYVHRVGRTARGETGTGRALLFLAPAELGFLRWLRDARVALHEYEFDMSKVTNIQRADEARRKKLLPASSSAGRLPVVPAGLRVARAQGHF